MKDWNILSEEELANLTDEQIEVYKKLIYAENGIKFPEKPKPIDIVNIPHDKTVYYIDNIGNIYFEDINEARAVIDCIKKCKTLCHKEYPKNSYNNSYIAPGNPVDYAHNPMDFNISTSTFYSKDKMQKCQDTIDTQRKLKEQYDKDIKEYEKINEQAITVTQSFLDTLSSAKEIINHRKLCAKKYYIDYLPLANGDEEIAMNFLKKAYNIDNADETYIKNHAEDYKQ